jgi:hypothetical protein
MLRTILLCQAIVLVGISAQEASFPLESVAIEGNRMPKETVLEITAGSGAKARKVSKLESGNPYDCAYSTDFFRELSKSVDFRQFKKVDVKSQKGSGDHVIDVTLTFEPK